MQLMLLNEYRNSRVSQNLQGRRYLPLLSMENTAPRARQFDTIVHAERAGHSETRRVRFVLPQRIFSSAGRKTMLLPLRHGPEGAGYHTPGRHDSGFEYQE
jgi:hypothetical protein